MPLELVERRTYCIRDENVMSSPDLTGLYQVETRADRAYLLVTGLFLLAATVP